jgi:hypothetical protein
MALTSPGVEVSVIDESFYTPAEPGTTPIIFVATAENKLNGAGTGIAPGTTAANAGKVYLMTSQRDLVETFGDPLFYTDTNNNPIHGGEQNEYGLQAAYSYLGVSNRAWVVRADIDLSALNASSTATAADPENGTYWLDTQTTSWGVFEWNGSALSTSNTSGQTFTNKAPIVITDSTKVASSSPYTPNGSVGQPGEYAIVAISTIPRLWYKNSSGTWVQVGSANWKASWPSVSSSGSTAPGAGEDFTLNGATITTSGTTFTTLASDIEGAGVTGVTAAVVDGVLEIYNDGTGTDSIILVDGTGTPLADAGISAGTYYAPKLQASKHTSVPEYKTSDSNPRPTGSIWVKTTEPNSGARWRTKVWNGDTATWDAVDAPIFDNGASAIYELDKAGGGANLLPANLYVKTNVTEAATNLANFTIYKRAAAGRTKIVGTAVSSVAVATYSVTIQETIKNSAAYASARTVSITTTGASTDAEVVATQINAAGFANIVASVDSTNRVVIEHTLGGEIRITDTDGLLPLIGFTKYNYSTKAGTANLYAWPGASSNQYEASLWTELTYTASNDAPTALAAQGALWYSSVVDEVDMLVHDGTKWVGLLHSDSPYYAGGVAADQPDPKGPIVSATEPDEQSDGTALKTGDIWISTADLDNYPTIYRYNGNLASWILLDATDQTTENGVLFADARWSINGGSSSAHEAGTIADLLTSSFVDPDAPDPALYPKGMLLWNLRRSGFNVKRFERNYIDLTADNTRFGDEDMSTYYPHRWVTESANESDGKGSFGRKAQRKVVVQKLQSLLNENQDIRDDESRTFNLIATPGYPELIGEMITLNYDRGLTAFVVGDSPMRLTSDATSLNEWATNVNTAVEDNDNGLVSRDEYLGVYYPSGFTSDNAGNNVVVPASHMVLRTIALNDQVAYPWFAPAGTRRGGVTNATSTGYINSEGEFVAAALNEGTRDTLYQNNVNPITFLSGAGLVVFGQKTRARNASALDRVNVARLVIYLRSQLNTLAKPYLFEPNDKITRDEIKQQVESLMVELVGLRALYDFLVVCDETNNTPARIDRNELYVDIAIEPVKAVEFIYIPLRIKNTGEIAGL